jgi:hypothetical protein
VNHSIEASYAPSIAPKTYKIVPWLSGVNPDALTMSQFKYTWDTGPADIDVDLLVHLWSNTNIVNEEKLSFLHSVLTTDSHNSIQVEDKAAHILADALKANYNPPFDYADIESKWSERFKTNQLSSAKGTNNPTQNHY